MASRICLRAVVLPCLAQSRPVTVKYSIPIQLQESWRARRIFATTPRHRKDDARARTVQQEEEQKQQQPSEEKVPESVAKDDKPAKLPTMNDPLLAERTVSNKEQRKADWAIIRDMAHYLWPKNDFNTRFRVGLSVGLLVGAKVGKNQLYPHSNAPLIDYVGPECASPILLQNHCRFHER